MSHDVQPKRRLWQWRLLALCLAGVLSCGSLLLAELAARVCFPLVNYQDTDASMLTRRPNIGYQWRPGVSGYCFGEFVHIDESGCRDLEYHKQAGENWLILGDSVTFGVGVPAQETFVGRVERALPGVHFRNASVVGMNLDGQLAKARELLARDSSIRRVTLFYCLNDLEDVAGDLSSETPCEFAGVADLSPAASSIGERVRGFLRSRSKLYLLLKGQLTDRSQTYFWCDYARYANAHGSTLVGLDRLDALADLAARHNARFEVVLLPYEYQLRDRQEKLWEPQRLVSNYLSERGIACHDARDWFEPAQDSRQWFLFGDPMHLSSAGHRQVASRWLRSMRGEEAKPQEHLVARPIDAPTTSMQ